MEIYDEMVKNMVFGTKNRRVFRMDTCDVVSPNKRYDSGTPSKRTRSLPVRNKNSEIIKNDVVDDSNREIDGSNITFYGQG